MDKEIVFACEKCGHIPAPNKDKSNENWKVFDNKQCEKCGGKLKIKLG